MGKYRIAAILMILHGGLMEIGGCLLLLPAMGSSQGAQAQAFAFIVPYFQQHLPLVTVMGAVYGALRVIGAVGLWRNRLWGLALSVINCAVTMALMIFMLPAGIVDGLLAGTALVLMLMQYFGARKAMD